MFNIGEWERALQSLRDRIDAEPANGKHWLRYAEFLSRESDDVEETLRAYQKAAELLPTIDFRARIGVGLVDVGRMRMDEGMACIKAHLAEDPSVEGYCFLAHAWMKNNRYDEAREACSAALEIEPTFEEAHFMMGQATKTSCQDSAIECFRRAVDLDDDYDLAWSSLGREIISRDESIREGVACLQKAVSISPENGFVRLYCANGLWRAGLIQDADAEFRAAIEVFPENKEFQGFYEEFLARPDNGRDARWPAGFGPTCGP